ncbi:Putative ubiquitin-conjugating enzyme E2, ubiquitin-conjugating enzyme/RWD [Septoria linicola]|uniref:Ubiquitin-conjugating enzyme E2, ubiquitin-conjugating enzyme/RWD n=1 Tax=Septoria linicola TaxID=215465 RepID=A0A9Q9AX06_9PEZI|nr:putative ubiquitin-conjugating enzyme E2, ubiquitin-conjugating enzyme/RWD [Septoria linicola]USW53361.1 Putative ubiquitin-conjugating enzyme E2, ubiquitin-conjugating enzyme/RWD [Septoria linicola]
MSLTLYSDDVVASKADEKSLAVVERTHGDIDTHAPFPGKEEDGPLRRDKDIPPATFKQFLRVGVPPRDTVLVRWQMPPGLELIPVSKLKLVDRSLLVGDIVKRSVQDAESGVVINTFTKCTLQPMCDVTYQNTKTIKGILPHDRFDPSMDFCVYPSGKAQPVLNVPASELLEVDTITEDSLVIYKDWIGKVEAITNNIQIRLTDNCVVEIGDEAAEQADGYPGSFCIGDIAKTKKGQLRTGKWIFGAYNANTTPVGTVVSVRTVGAEVTWIQRRIGCIDERQPPLVLESEELDSPYFTVYQRDRRADDGRSPTSPTISNSEIDVRLGLRVRFRDLTGACVKYGTQENPDVIPRLDRQANLGYDLNVFDIIKFETTVSVQWQDLSITTERSTGLLPDSSIDDEHAAWPGEIAHTLSLKAVPAMPFVDQPERVGVVQAVNAAERMAKVRWLQGSYIHYTNDPDDHLASPTVVAHSVVPSSGNVEEISLYDIEAPGSLNYRRGDMILISSSPYNTLQGEPSDITWIGELVDTALDGTLVVRLGAATNMQDVTLRREECIVAVRSDGTNHVDAWDGDEQEEDIDWSGSEDADEESDIDWDSVVDSEEEDLPVRYEDENGEEMDEDQVENEDWESADDDEDITMHDALQVQTPPTSHSVTPTDTSEPKVHSTPSAGIEIDAEPPPPYLILDGDVPPDHRFANQTATRNSAHAKRTQKEHKILRSPSSLPAGVYVRAWETRLDLLRCLIIGPTDTPYANAPFVVDFYLPPTFPAEPPQVSFHSWPSISSIGTLGRVNPNLYEDGKICLSLLGTWEGTKGEGWSASRSTLLQVIVSLLGLVLVREPYYNEAGYEALVGDEASKRPSALYSERVFLRAKGFLITALSALDTTSGLKGLEDILRWTYFSEKGPRLLESAIANVEEVLGRSVGIAEADGLTVMSKGACIPLKRVLARLTELSAGRQL